VLSREPSTDVGFNLPWSRKPVLVATDGQVRATGVELPGDVAVRRFAEAPGGRIVVLSTRDLMPGIARQDGPNVEGLQILLTVFEQTGEVVFEEDVRVVGEDVSLIGASSDEVFLQRYVPGSEEPSRISALSLAGGAERVVVERTDIAASGAAAHSLIALAGGGRNAPCEVEIISSVSGATVQRFDLPDCMGVAGVALSDDGERAAVGYSRLSGGVDQVNIAAREVMTGAVISDRTLGRTGPYGPPEIACGAADCAASLLDFGGIGFSQDGTVQVVVLRHPSTGELRDVTFDSLELVTV
jgi:hypothetical protein